MKYGEYIMLTNGLSPKFNSESRPQTQTESQAYCETHGPVPMSHTCAKVAEFVRIRTHSNGI